MIILLTASVRISYKNNKGKLFTVLLINQDNWLFFINPSSKFLDRETKTLSSKLKIMLFDKLFLKLDKSSN